MKKTTTLFSFLSVCLFISCTDDNVFDAFGLYQEIQQAKNSGEVFESVSVFTLATTRSASQSDQIQEKFINSQEVYILHYDKSAARSFNSFMSLQVSLGRRTMQLQLQEVKVDYIVTTSCGQVLPPNPNIRHYPGVVEGAPNSVVAITFGENKVIGLVATDEGNFNIVFDQQLGAHLFLALLISYSWLVV